MKFIRDLLSRKSSQPMEQAEPAQDVAESPAPEQNDQPDSAEVNLTLVDDDAPKMAEIEQAADEILDKINSQVATPPAPTPVSIWDLDGDDTADAAPQEAPTPRRRRRNQTRLLGFDDTDNTIVSAFEAAEKAAPAERTKFPVGWMLVAEGPGRGECFTLEAGMSQIGRADDQAIQLDFGDNSISRVNHAAIVYDTETHNFILGHGGKKNIVRLNGSPVISNEEIKTGDEIKIGETTLRFVSLCGEDFNWADQDTGVEELDDVAIA